jgi:hypothetical protein
MSRNRRALPTVSPVAAAPSLKIHCPVFNHIKNTIVCSVCCELRDKCKEFQKFYEENRAAQDASVNAYIESHHRLPPGSLLVIQYSLEVIRKMSDTYVWIDQDDRAEVMTFEQVLQAAETGRKPKHIFLTKQELALRYQLVPKNRREDAVKDTKSTPKAVELPKAGEEEDDKPKKRPTGTGKAVA